MAALGNVVVKFGIANTLKEDIRSEIFVHGDVDVSEYYGCTKLTTKRYNPIVLADGRTRQIIEEDIYSDRGRRQTIARHRVSVHTKPNSVTIVYRAMLTGINKHSGKRYYRWETQSVNSIFKTSLGNIATLRRERLKGRGLIFTTTYHNVHFLRMAVRRGGNIINDAMKMVFGKEITINDIFPALRVFKDTKSTHDWPQYFPTKALRNDDPKELITIAFGGYSKALRRALATHYVSPSAMKVIGAMDIPMDWKAELVSNNPERFRYSTIHMDTNRLFNILDKNQRKSMFGKIVAGNDSASLDAVRILNQLVDRGVDITSIIKLRDMGEIHDRAWVVLDELKNKNVPIDCWNNPELNMGVGNIDWYLASDTYEMRDWGRKFSHCIGSYVNSVEENNIFGVIRRDGKELGNFQIRDGSLLQFYGINNTSLKHIDKDAYGTFINHLQGAGYDTSYWQPSLEQPMFV